MTKQTEKKVKMDSKTESGLVTFEESLRVVAAPFPAAHQGAGVVLGPLHGLRRDARGTKGAAVEDVNDTNTHTKKKKAGIDGKRMNALMGESREGNK